MKKKFVLTCLLAIICLKPYAQMVYNDYEPKGMRYHHFGFYNGMLDSAFANPLKSGINTSDFSSKYTRNDTVFYDVLNLNLVDYLKGVEKYAAVGGTVPKIKIKLFTNQLPGAVVDLQLGRKDDLNYPSGTHSHYRSFTTISNAWEVMEFDFIQKPNGSLTGPNDVDRISIFFEPETFNKTVFFFDELTGPELISVNIAAIDNGKNMLGQNFPNPASSSVTIPFSLSTAQYIKMELYDLTGKNLGILAQGNFNAGNHNIGLSVIDLTAGYYVYRLVAEDQVQTKQMVIISNK